MAINTQPIKHTKTMTLSTLKLRYETALKREFQALDMIKKTKNPQKIFKHEADYKFYSAEAKRIDQERRIWMANGHKQGQKETVGAVKNKYA